MFKHLNRSTRPEINTNKLDTPTPSSINPYVNHVAEQLYNKANPNEYVVVFRVTYTGTLIEQLLSTQFSNQISLAVYEQLKNKLFAYIVVQPDDDSLQDTKHIFVKTNAASSNELVFTNFSNKGDCITLSIKKNGSAFLVNVSVSDNSSVTYATLLSKINELSDTVNDTGQDVEDLETRVSDNEGDIGRIDESLLDARDRITTLEKEIENPNVDLSNYYTKEQTLDAIDIEVEDLRQEIGNFYVKLKDPHIKSVDYNIQTGIFTFTKQDGTILEVDLAIEKVVANFKYNSKTTSLELTLADGTVQSIPMVDFAQAILGVENDYIQVVVQSGNKIQAILKDSSITLDKLSDEVKSIMQNHDENIKNLKEKVNTLEESLNTTDEDVNALDTRITALEKNQGSGGTGGLTKDEVQEMINNSINSVITEDY